MPRSTMLWRSSGSMTTLSASRIWSCVGVGMARKILAGTKNKPAGPRRTPPAEGGEILHCQAGYEARQLFPVPYSPAVRGEVLASPGREALFQLNEVRSGRPEVL